MYAVSAPNVLRDGPHYIPALTAGQVVDLSDYITPGAPLTPDQAAILTARIVALETTLPTTAHSPASTTTTTHCTPWPTAPVARSRHRSAPTTTTSPTRRRPRPRPQQQGRATLDLVSGTNTGDQVLPTWSTISGKPAVVAEGATQADAAPRSVRARPVLRGLRGPVRQTDHHDPDRARRHPRGGRQRPGHATSAQITDRPRRCRTSSPAPSSMEVRPEPDSSSGAAPQPSATPQTRSRAAGEPRTRPDSGEPAWRVGPR